MVTLLGRSGRLAQMARALPLQGRGRRFESVNAHHRKPPPQRGFSQVSVLFGGESLVLGLPTSSPDTPPVPDLPRTIRAPRPRGFPLVRSRPPVVLDRSGRDSLGDYNGSGKHFIDIGTHWGHMCHKFEELGFECVATELLDGVIPFLTGIRDAVSVDSTSGTATFWSTPTSRRWMLSWRSTSCITFARPRSCINS